MITDPLAVLHRRLLALTLTPSAHDPVATLVAVTSVLRDEVEYELPLGVFGRIVGGAFARRELARLFAYRHLVTRAACEGTAPWPT